MNFYPNPYGPAVIKSHAARDQYERRLIGFLKRLDARSPDAFFEFAKSNPALAENFGLQ
jgi:hypothetical protein